jgi:RimJ/RimL family protein N-acetyltransferase
VTRLDPNVRDAVTENVPSRAGNAAPVPTAHLTGRYCALRQFAPADYEWFYGVCMQPENLMTFRFGGIPPSPDRFAAIVWQGVNCQFVVTKPDRPMDRIGAVTFYGQNDHTQVASFAVVFHQDFWQGGWPWEGVVLAIDHYFRIARTRKLCVEVAEWNLPRFAGFEAFGLRHEGCLREHEFMDGRYWDRHVYALFRDDWSALRSTVLRRFGAPSAE